LFLFSTTSRPPRSPLFPYTTLFRSLDPALVLDADRVRVGTVGVPRDAVLAHHLRDVAVGRAHDVVRRDAVLARHVVDGALVAALGGVDDDGGDLRPCVAEGVGAGFDPVVGAGVLGHVRGGGGQGGRGAGQCGQARDGGRDASGDGEHAAPGHSGGGQRGLIGRHGSSGYGREILARTGRR